MIVSQPGLNKNIGSEPYQCDQTRTSTIAIKGLDRGSKFNTKQEPGRPPDG